MRALPGDYEGKAENWEQLMSWLLRLGEAARTVQVHLGPQDGDDVYLRLEGQLHHVLSTSDGHEWFIVGDTAPELYPGYLHGPWNYVRLSRNRYAGASIETIDDDDIFSIVIDFGARIVRISDAGY